LCKYINDWECLFHLSDFCMGIFFFSTILNHNMSFVVYWVSIGMSGYRRFHLFGRRYFHMS